MKLKIGLSKYNENGSLAYIEDESGCALEVVEGKAVTAKTACLNAAKALREAAARFELLAQAEQPYQGKVHAKINRAKLTPPSPAGTRCSNG